MLLAGCSPKVVTKTVTEYKDRVEYRDRLQYDTVYEKEAERIYTLHDTVFVDRYKYIYKEHLQIDTTYVCKIDSIPYEVQVPVEVQRELNWMQKLFIRLGILMMIIIIGAAAYGFLKWKHIL